jgi:ribose transport system substrate-binding protein
MHRTTRLAAGAVALLLISGSSALAQSPAAADEAWTKSDVLSGFDPLSVDLEGSTPGPNGEESVSAADIADPTPECLEQVKGLKLAFLNGFAGNTWMGAIEAGVRAKAEEYGIEVVATASSDFDPAKEATAVETLMASQPDILVTIPVDPTAGATNYKPALDAGTTLVFYDNPVDGWTGGNEYVGIVTGDHYRMGKNAADLLASAMGETGTYGFIQLDVPFYNSTNRE